MTDRDTKKKQVRKLREQAVEMVNQSSALEGYKPLSSADGLPYKLQQKWVNSEITSDEVVELLIKEYSDN